MSTFLLEHFSLALHRLFNLEHGRNRLRELVGLEIDKPRASIVILSLVFLGIFSVTSILALKFPIYTIKLTISLINGVLSGFLLISFVLDIKSKDGREYKRNLANTVLTVSFTIIAMTALYCHIWYDNLNTEAIHLLSRSVSSPRFPAVAVLQKQVHSMAVLQDSPLKCFLGDWLDHAPLCTGLTSQEVLNSPSCDCSDRWPTLETLEQKANRALWLGQNTTYYAMKRVRVRS